ncbi:MAG: hypothetical protein KY461_06855 [Actinobacteria bacterium]|nr:hypothetical protein [Actinomycetota bacterium]
MVIVAIGTGPAVVWWLGLALVVLVVVPLVLFLARDIILALAEIRRYSEDILEHGVGLAGALDPVPELAHTRELTQVALGQFAQLAAGLKRLFGGTGR